MVISGDYFQDGAVVDMGSGIAVQRVTFNSEQSFTCTIRINRKASLGSREVTITNPDGKSGTLIDGFTIQ